MMAICVYCGRSAGLFRRQHSDCSNRHVSAIQLIPSFVDRYLSNPIPVARFTELMQAGAKQSFISGETIKASVALAVSRFINLTLEQRLITMQEEQDIVELLQAFEITVEGEIFEQIVKADTLRRLQSRETPDRVEVVDPLPIELAQDERVLWVFNGVESKRDKTADDAEDARTWSSPASTYIKRVTAEWPSAPKKLLLEMSGDLIITNHNLHLVSSEHVSRRIRFSHVRDFQAYSNALGVLSVKEKNDRKLKVARIIALDDPWFAANLISCLTTLSRNERTLQINASL